MVTKKELVKAGIERNYKLKLVLRPEREEHICYFMGFNFDGNGNNVVVANSTGYARTGTSSLVIPVRDIQSYKILRKDLEPVTKKELKELDIEKGSGLELMLKDGKRFLGFVDKLVSKYVSLTLGLSAEPQSMQILYHTIDSYQKVGLVGGSGI